MDKKENINDDDLENQETNDEFINVKSFQGSGYNINPIKATSQTMTDKQYIEERLDDQIKYFANKSSKAQKKYKNLKRWEIFIAATIPVIIAFSTLSVFENIVFIQNVVKEGGKEVIKPVFTLSTVFQIIAALGGVAIVILKGVTDLEEHFKTWKEYRAVEMNLTQEKYKFSTRTEPYDESNAYALLVEQVEQILNKENQKWRSMKKHTNDFSKKIQQKMLEDYEKKNKKAEDLSDVDIALDTDNNDEVLG